MTVKNLNNIDIYFHMRNHYKKIKDVKSKIDISCPKGFTKKSSASHSERSFPFFNNITKIGVKKHSCMSLETKSDTSVTSGNISTRPVTRRHPYEMPSLQTSRSRSVGAVSKRDSSLQKGIRKLKRKKTIKANSKPLADSNKTATETESYRENSSARTNSSRNSKNKRLSLCENSPKMYRSSKSKSEEHEYLQFLLRITEDIILNNYFKNEDIERVFHNHIEANRDRLNLEKMEVQLKRLANELNIPYKNCNENTDNILESIDFSTDTTNLQNCECTVERSLDIQDLSYLENNEFKRNLEEIVIYKHSLGRLTECTEPSNSVDTILNAPTKFTSVTTVSSFGNVDILPCFENGELDNTLSNFYYERLMKESLESIKSKGVLLTEKERIGCLEEDIIYKKINKNCEDLAENAESETPEKSENFAPKNNSHNSTASTNRNDNLTVVDLPRQIPVPCFEDKYIQAAVSQIDKECNTSDFNLLAKENDYVRINKPVYIQKHILDSEKRYVLLETEMENNDEKSMSQSNEPVESTSSQIINKRNTDDEAPVSERIPVTPSQENNINMSDYSLDPESSLDSFYIRKMNYSKLLNTDYDLTPERDSDCSNKYHQPLTDAVTSVSDTRNNLLLTEGYSINKEQASVNDQLCITNEYSLCNSQIIGHKHLSEKFSQLSMSVGNYGVNAEMDGSGVGEETSESGEVRASLISLLTAQSKEQSFSDSTNKTEH